MKTHVAFLRGINVGGKGMVRMADLQKAYAQAGAREVRTFIQSGNVVFATEEAEVEAVGAKVAARLKKLLGWEPVVMYRTAEELRKLVKAEPFKPFAGEAGAKWYVTFLAERPKVKLKLPIVVEKEAIEVIGLKGRELCVLSREKKDGHFGFPNAWAEKTLKTSATSRNWNTVVKMAELAGGVLRVATEAEQG
jgi:uncharacterized protein (DUF1697 family)